MRLIRPSTRTWLASPSSRVLKGRTVADYLSEKIWRPAGMEADANWVLDKVGIERGAVAFRRRCGITRALACSSPKAMRDLRALCCRLAGSIARARPCGPPQTVAPVMAGSGGCARTAVMKPWAPMASRSPFIPEDGVVIAVNAASRDPPGFGIARWRLLQALDAAAVGRSDPNDQTK